jgi:hypothetical protein
MNADISILVGDDASRPDLRFSMGGRVSPRACIACTAKTPRALRPRRGFLPNRRWTQMNADISIFVGDDASRPDMRFSMGGRGSSRA